MNADERRCLVPPKTACERLAAGKVQIDVDGFTALCLLGQLQLASRHPANTGHPVQVASVFARELEARIIAIEPTFAAICAAGWNPAMDH